MSKTKDALIKSAFHTLEVVLLGGAVLFVIYLFRDDADIMAALKDAVLIAIPVGVPAFLAKLAREHDKVPIKDYVNER